MRDSQLVLNPPPHVRGLLSQSPMIAAKPLDQERQCICANMVDRDVRSVHLRVSAKSGSSPGPVTQFFPVVFRLSFSGPKHQYADPHQYTNSQDDGNPSPAHALTVPENLKTGILFDSKQLGHN